MITRVEHRGYTASLTGTKMRIRDWNGDIVKEDRYWKYSFEDVERRLKEEIDRYIALAPFTREGWWRDAV